VPQLVEVHAVLRVERQALVQVVANRELGHKRGAHGYPGAMKALLAELLAALSAEHQVVVDPAWLVEHRSVRRFRDVDRAGAVVLRRRLSAQLGVELRA